MAAAFAYKFIAATAGVACNATFEADDIDSVCPVRLSTPRKILVAVMVAYEADTLQIALSEYDGIADILISENLNVHNPHEKTPKPFYLWPRIKALPEFSRFESKIFWQGCTNKRVTLKTYEAEDLDEWCETRQVQNLTKLYGYDIIIVGSVDEVLSRRELLRLWWCRDIPRLPTQGAIGMPMGLLGRSFRTDWPPPNMPWAFSMPKVYGNNDALTGQAKRNLGRDHNSVPLVGGLHLTNYCFLPAMILKEVWTSDYGHNLDTIKSLSSLKAMKRACYENFNARIRASTGPETVVPRFLNACASRFPSWHGGVDGRELHFYASLQKSNPIRL